MKKILYIVAALIISASFFPIVALSQGVNLEGLHIMQNGDVMLGNGEVLNKAKALSDGTVMLEDGQIVTPMMDMRTSDSIELQRQQEVMKMMTQQKPLNNSGTNYAEAKDVSNGLSVDLTTFPKNPISQSRTYLEFFANEKPKGSPVTELEIGNEMFMHVIGVRNDLEEFFHIHPKQDPVSPGLWGLNYIFENPGAYKVWSEVRKDGQMYTFGQKPFSVSGSGDITTSRAPEFTENIILGEYQIAINMHDELSAGRSTEINLIMGDVFGQGIELEPYLGAGMHLIAIKDDLKEFVHAHSNGFNNKTSQEKNTIFTLINRASAHVEDSGLNKMAVTFNVVFPKEGIYKLFAQFRPKDVNLPADQALVAEFYVQVGPATGGSSTVVATGGDNFVGDGHTDHTHAPVSSGPWYQDKAWWALFVTSLILMAVLSRYVYKYLGVKK